MPEIISFYDFIDRFPIYVKIVLVDEENHKIQGILDSQTLDFYKKLVNENLDAVFVSGETKGQLKKALVRSAHLRDFISIIRFGFLENIIILKENTSAPGIIADIGKYLRKCKISAIKPDKLRTFLLSEN